MLGGREDLHCLNGASGTDSAGHRISPKTVASPGTYQGTGRRPVLQRRKLHEAQHDMVQRLVVRRNLVRRWQLLVTIALAV